MPSDKTSLQTPFELDHTYKDNSGDEIKIIYVIENPSVPKPLVGLASNGSIWTYSVDGQFLSYDKHNPNYDLVLPKTQTEVRTGKLYLHGLTLTIYQATDHVGPKGILGVTAHGETRWLDPYEVKPYDQIIQTDSYATQTVGTRYS